jgi:2-methylcitrate dehydratase
MDATTTRIAEFATEFRFDDIPADVVGLAVDRVLDTLACAIGGRHSNSSRIARCVSPRLAENGGAATGYVLGEAWRTAPEFAAFANTAMIRSLDFNDRYPGVHPSDMIGALLAMAGTPGVDGKRLLTSVVVAYEVATRFADAANMRGKWDAGYFTGIGAVAGLSHLLRVTTATAAQALSLFATANLSLRSTRAGALSMWKGAATAHATFNATFVLRLAQAGMSAPDNPIEGRQGLWERVSGPFELPPFPNLGGEYLTRKTSLKYWPVDYSAQNAIWAARRLARTIPLDALSRVRVGMHQHGWRETASEAAKWDPQSRETADHSLPYVFIRAMQHDGVDLSIFEPEQYLDPKIRPAMAQVTVEPDPDCDAVHPDGVMLKCDAVAADGRTESFILQDPRGFWTNPMSAAEVEAKFLRFAEPAYGIDWARSQFAFWKDMSSWSDLNAGLQQLIAPAGDA